MWYQSLKHLCSGYCCLGNVGAGLDDRARQARSRGKDRNTRIRREFTLYDSILKDTNPKTRLDKLQEWQTKYATTDFEKQRKQLFLDTYVKLNQPKEAVAEAKLILADNPKDFTSLYYTMYFTRALAGNNPHPGRAGPGREGHHSAFGEYRHASAERDRGSMERRADAGGDPGPLDARMDRDATQELGRGRGRVPKDPAAGSQQR